MTAARRYDQSPVGALPLAACDRAWAQAAPDAAVRVTGVTTIVGDGPYLEAHFPDVTIFPGVFVLEAVAQAVALALGKPRGALRLSDVRSLRLLAPLYPGDVLRVDATVAGTDEVDVVADCHRRGEARVATVAATGRWS